MRAFFRHLAPVGALLLALGAPSAYSASSAIDPDPRAPTLGELLAREEAARARVERVVEPATAPVPAVTKSPASVASGVAPLAAGAPRGGVRQVHPDFVQPAVTVLVPGGKLGR